MNVVPSYAVHDVLEDAFGMGSTTELFLVIGVVNPERSRPWVSASFLQQNHAVDHCNKLNEWVKQTNCRVTWDYTGVLADKLIGESYIAEHIPWNAWLLQYVSSGSIQMGGPPQSYPVQSGQGSIYHLPSGGIISGYIDFSSITDSRSNLICPYDKYFKWTTGGVFYVVHKTELRI